ncbi:MAG TPA: thymidine phosphorylase, partial [Ilumatobacteraceae bacterium]|nr:thymidine phosphorylase [Ilumatobacteraceae bacterium]
FFNGMDLDERVALTRAMARSGESMRWDRADLHGPVVDKHSTGGVGDKVSLMLAPLVATCGAHVPMISGRGLGHTGGTLDKLESIPGYTAKPDMDLFHKVVAEVGCAIIGQTSNLAPADGRLYAIRDVTATVESIPLITASILSKKLAAGLDALVMDVKFGNGAFMSELPRAEELAHSIVSVARQAGLVTNALLTDMNQVLGRTAGNSLEVVETVDWLTGTSDDSRLTEVVIALGAEMLVVSQLAGDIEDARARLIDARQSGRAAERFQQMVTALGGPDLLNKPSGVFERAPIVRSADVTTDGYVESVDTRAVGLAVVALGGGRVRVEDSIDHAVGLTEIAAVGERVGADRPLAVVHARTEAAAEQASNVLRSAYKIADQAKVPGPVVSSRITA